MIVSKRELALFTLVGCGLMSLSSCSGQDIGQGLAISVTPTTAYIVQSDGSSCTDILSGTSSATGLSQSVTGPRLLFTNFKIQWQSADPLTIAVIRVTVVGPGLQPFATELSNDEVNALIGQVGGIITTNEAINSNSTINRGNFPPCGLNIGGLTLNGKRAEPTIPPAQVAGFNARVLIEVIGTAMAADQTVRPVKQSYYASAKFLD